MVKGVSRQVIVVQSPDPKLFEQAIFILRDEAVANRAITDEMLLREAKRLINGPDNGKKHRFTIYGPVWACAGALLTAAVWILSTVL